jgi:hypothetical protein
MAQSILTYGKSGSTKTSQIRYIAEYVWEKFGKRTRMITSDTGSLWAPVEDLVDAGIIIPLLFPTDPAYNPLSTMRKLRRGEWPSDGALKPAKKLSNGQFQAQSLWRSWSAEDAKEIGAYAVESLTSYGSGILRDLAEKNISVGAGNVPGLRTEEGETFASNTMQHYGMGQSEILEMLNSFIALPVELVYFTALEGAGEDDDGPTKRTVLGPKSLGKAITEVIPQRVGDCLHLVDATDDKGQREIRAYLRNHPDSQVAKMNWPAKVRLLNTPEVLKAFQQRYPEGFMKLTVEDGLGELLRFKDEMAALAKTRITKLEKVS